MALATGTQLGPYEILGPIGKGGMGEVYRARDPRLGREVAIKVSAEKFSERFERECRAIAALNHPNICQIYDVGSDYLVMELVEGEAPKGPMPLEEAWKVMRQVADALDAAHEKGIVHRDLKPGNIMVRPDGAVKVLDFGLAKVGGTAAVSTIDSPTMTIGATQMGMILGTAAYMAPEQARGRLVDKRADIWAFGVVFHEMLTGKRLFQGEDLTETLASVVKEQPDFSTAPPRARLLLARCLEKDPRKRLRDIGDWELLMGSEPGDSSAPLAKRPLWSWLAAVCTIALAALAVWFYFRQPPGQVLPTITATLLPPDGQDFEFANLALPRLSPDGSRLVFRARARNGRPQLYVRRLDSTSAQLLAGTDDALYPFWSADSRWIGFGQGRMLMKFDLQGSSPVPVADLPGRFEGGTWNTSGVILFGVGDPSKPLYRVPAAGGIPVPATTIGADESAYSHVQPWFLPDGKHFLYTTYQNGDIPVRVGSLDEPGKPGKVVAKCDSNAAYAQGYLLCGRAAILYAQPFDLDRLATTGDPISLAQNISSYTIQTRTAAFGVSGAGLVTYQTLTNQQVTFRLLRRDRGGKELGELPAIGGSVEGMHLSPDGKRLAVHVWDFGQSTTDIWVYDLLRGVPTRLTFDPAQDFEPVWGSDGQAIFFRSGRLGGDDLYKVPASGVGKDELVFGDKVTKSPTDVSPDGKTLLFARGGEIWSLDPNNPGRAQPFAPIPRSANGTSGRATFSPDGKWVTYVSSESGRAEIYAVATSGQGGKRQVSSGGGTKPRWRRDGREIFFMHGRELMAIDVSIRNGALETGRPHKLFDGIVDCCGMMYDVEPDGQKFYVVEGEDLGSGPLTLVQNWVGLLRR